MLQRAGLLKYNSEGRLAAADSVIDTGDDYSKRLDTSDARRMLDYHLQAFAVWKHRLAELASADRELALFNIPLNRARLEEFTARLLAF